MKTEKSKLMKSPSDLENKIIVITGGAGLIGRGFVKAVVENGGTAIIADIDELSGRTVKEELSKELRTDKIEFIRVDITSKESIKRMTDAIVNKHNVIDALVNNAYPRNKSYGNKLTPSLSSPTVSS